MRYLAQPYPVGASPFVVRAKSKCHYPWCSVPEFLDGDRDKAVNASVVNEAGATLTGPMHVRHTIFAHRYDGGREEVYEDDLEPPALRVPRHASGMLLEEVVNTRPTAVEYVSNVESLIKLLNAGEVLVIQKAGGSARRTRVHVWRKTL